MLAHAEAEVPSFVGTLLEVLGALEERAVGRRQVGRSADQFRHDGSDRVERRLRHFAGRQVLVLADDELRHVVADAVGELAGEAAVDLGGLFGELGRVLLEHGGPRRVGLGSLGGGIGEDLLDVLRHVEAFIRWQAVVLLGALEVVHSQRRPVRGAGALLGRGPVPDQGLAGDDGRLVGDALGILDGGAQIVQLRDDVLHGLHVPPVRLVALLHVLREGQGGVAVDGDVVVIVKDDQLAETQVPRQRGGFAGDALLQAPVSADDVGVIVKDRVIGVVVGGSQVAFGHGQADGVGNALSERARANLDSIRDILGMPRSLRADLPKCLQIFNRQSVPSQMQHRVLQGARMPIRQHEPVASNPLGLRRRVLHQFDPQQVRERRAAHGRSGVSGIGTLRLVGGDRADGVHAFEFQFGALVGWRRSFDWRSCRF
mmetsp:Transcript_5031/g.14687  ORF Transcript_5031/g.14687 Transcript_5031/m.14687 type:complete len:429 (-) Transcript_5031:364-1650(-)